MSLKKFKKWNSYFIDYIKPIYQIICETLSYDTDSPSQIRDIDYNRFVMLSQICEC